MGTKAWGVTSLLAASALMATALAPSAMADEGGLFVVKGYGERNWRAACELTSDRGRTLRPDARGSGSRSRLVLTGRDVVSGSCTITASPRGPIEVRLEPQRGPQFVCPFEGVAADAACRTVVASGESLTFDVTLAGS